MKFREVPSWISRAVDGGLFVLPVLSTVALYLPGGLLMPARIVSLCLVVAGFVVWVNTRSVGGCVTWWVTVTTCSLFVLFGALGAYRYPDRFSATEAVQVLSTQITVLACVFVTRRLRSVLALVWGWLFAGVLAAIPAIWEITTGKYMPKNGPVEYYGPVPGLGTTSFFDNPNLYAYHCSVVLLLIPVMFVWMKQPWRWLLIPCGCVIAYLLSTTLGRVAMIGFLVGLLVWILRLRVGRILMAGLALGLGLAVIARIPPVIALVERFASEFSEINVEHESLWQRAQLARTGWWIMEQTSWLGTGPGGFGKWSLAWGENPYWADGFTNPHWGLVEVGSQYGMITLTVFLGGLAWIAFYGVSWSRRTGMSAHSTQGVTVAVSAVFAMSLPILCMSHSTWLQQPLTAVHLATMLAVVSWAEQHRSVACSAPASRAVE